jgi:hypothetical protein
VLPPNTIFPRLCLTVSATSTLTYVVQAKPKVCLPGQNLQLSAWGCAAVKLPCHRVACYCCFRFNACIAGASTGAFLAGGGIIKRIPGHAYRTDNAARCSSKRPGSAGKQRPTSMPCSAILARPPTQQCRQHIRQKSLPLHTSTQPHSKSLQRGAGPMALMLWLDWVT